MRKRRYRGRRNLFKFIKVSKRLSWNLSLGRLVLEIMFMVIILYCFFVSKLNNNNDKIEWKKSVIFVLLLKKYENFVYMVYEIFI